MFKISIKNFQSLESVVLGVNGLTILRGESGAGKSAVIRCMKALLLNRWGKGMKRNGTSYIDAAVDFGDGNVLYARKPDTGIIYRIKHGDGSTQDYTAMRRDIPEELGKIIGLTVMDDGTSKALLQIRSQYDRPLLIELPHKRLSGMLGDGSEWIHCTNTDKMVHSWVTSQKGREKGLQEMEQASNDKITSIKDVVSGLSDKVEQIKSLYQSIAELQSRLDTLKSLSQCVLDISSVDMLCNKCKSISESFVVLSSDIERLSLLRQLDSACTPIVGVESIKKILMSLDVIGSLNSMRNSYVELQDVLSKEESDSFVIKDLHSRLDSDVCPICGAKLVN